RGRRSFGNFRLDDGRTLAEVPRGPIRYLRLSPETEPGEETEAVRRLAELLDCLVCIHDTLLFFGIRMGQLIEENPYGMFSDEGGTKASPAQQQEIRDRILAWFESVQEVIGEAKVRCDGIAGHLPGARDKSADWETDLRAN